MDSSRDVPPPDLAALLRPGVALRATRDGIASVLPEAEEEASYDRMVGGYDALIGNGLYNRIVWGASTRGYAATARRVVTAAVAAGRGPVLDCGCGSLVFTADSYRDVAPARLLLFDRSLGMMRRARSRLPAGRFLQGDATDLPFAPATFGATVAWGMLHIFGTGSAFLPELHRVTMPGGTVAVSSLVGTGRMLGDRALALLHRNGEIAAPQPAAVVEAAFAALFGITERSLDGSMLTLIGTRS